MLTWTILGVRPEVPAWEAIDPRTGCRVRRLNINRRIDLTTQLLYVDHVYYVRQPDGTEQRVADSFVLRYYYEEQLRALIVSAGFRIVDGIGYYGGRPLDRGPEMIFICEAEG